MTIKRLILYITIMAIPVVILFIYILFVTGFTLNWKNNLGTFGDSFGVVNALFTGLTFSGLIITLLQQREEIKIQKEDLLDSRKEFKRSADAQEKTARLTAFSDLLKEYNEKIKILDIRISEGEKQHNANRTQVDLLRNELYNSKPYKHPMTDELKEIKAKKDKIMSDLEKYLQESAINKG